MCGFLALIFALVSISKVEAQPFVTVTFIDDVNEPCVAVIVTGPELQGKNNPVSSIVPLLALHVTPPVTD